MGDRTGLGHATEVTTRTGPAPTDKHVMARFLPVSGLETGSELLRLQPLPHRPLPGRHLRGHRGFSAPAASRTQKYQVAQSHRPTLHVASTIRYADCVRRGAGHSLRDRARPPRPHPAEVRWGCWENYIISAPGPELLTPVSALTPIPALSARIQSNCHHT